MSALRMEKQLAESSTSITKSTHAPRGICDLPPFFPEGSSQLKLFWASLALQRAE